MCRHNTVVMHGVFSLLYDALVNMLHVWRRCFVKYKVVYFFSLLCISMFNLLDTKFLYFLMLPYLMVFMSMCNWSGIDIGCV